MKTTRRTFLGGVAAASMPVTACVAATTNQALETPKVTAENPDLLAAFKRLQSAQKELWDAEDALVWIADEWRHLWPLAPEELLGVANADRGYHDDSGEKDIIGNYLIRDTSALTRRFNKKQRQKTPFTCFSVTSALRAEKNLNFWLNLVPKGRTERALGESRANRLKQIERYQHCLPLAREYEAATKRLREAAGVDKAKARVKTAEADFFQACDDVSRTPAFGIEGMHIKASAINASSDFETVLRFQGFFGDMARFIQHFSDLGRVASS